MDGLMEAGDGKKAEAMTRNDMQILIVAKDSRTIASIASEIVTQLEANITIVDTVEEARLLTATEVYDVVLAHRALEDGRGASLIKPLGIPVVLIDGRDDAQGAIEAFRAGAADVVDPREGADAVIESIERVVESSRKQHHTLSRNRRLRRVSSRLIKDRRELRQRVDLICRDLVQAYQRLAEKVVSAPSGYADSNEQGR